MASKPPQRRGIDDHCEECGETQSLEVSITILTESPSVENAEFSREPYRITECQACGATTKTRMNGA